MKLAGFGAQPKKGLLLLGTVVALGLGLMPFAQASTVRWPLGVTLTQQQTTTLWVVGTNRIQLDYAAPQSGVLWLTQNSKITGHPVPFATGTGTFTLITNMPQTIQRLDVRLNTAGTVTLASAALSGPGPQLLSSPPTRPKLVVYGDSITVGQGSGGPWNDSGGYADRLTNAWDVDNLALSGSSATCRGLADVGKVVAAQPSGVLISYGTNDITGDYFGCRGTVADFRAAMTSIIQQIQQGVPRVTIWIGAIIPRLDAHASEVPTWNAALKMVAAGTGVPFEDPTPVLNTSTDYFDALHPNAKGHRAMARFWMGIL